MHAQAAGEATTYLRDIYGDMVASGNIGNSGLVANISESNMNVLLHLWLGKVGFNYIITTMAQLSSAVCVSLLRGMKLVNVAENKIYDRTSNGE